MNIDDLDELISTEEGAAILGTDRKMLGDLIDAGKVRAFKEATKGDVRPFRVRVLKGELERLAAEGWRVRKPRQRRAEE